MKNMMKKLLAALCAMMMVLSVSAAFAQDDSLQKVKDKGELVLGLDASFPPMGFTDDNGNVVGFDIDVAREVCARLGVTLICQPIDWDAKEMELNSGNIDCIWNGMTITEERLTNMSVSVPYLRNAQVLVVKADSGIKTLADLKDKKIALQTGSSAEDALNAAADFKASLKEAVLYEDNMVALKDLDVGGVDAVLLDKVVAEYYIKTKAVAYTVLSEALADEEYGIGFRKTDAALCDAVNSVMLDMVKDGKMAEISKAWFGEDITVVGESAAQ